MPNLDSLGVPEYAAGQPYHHEYDNLPLKVLAKRDEMINQVVDVQTAILQDCAGTQGTLANRLIQSIDEDGNLKTAAVDEALHNIGAHTDGTYTVSPAELSYITSLGYVVSQPVPFVRMTDAERSKLAFIQENATDLQIQILDTPSSVPSLIFGNGSNPVLNLSSSASISWNHVNPSTIMPEVTFSLTSAHEHHYDLEPLDTDFPAGYINYQAAPSITEFIEDSLRVYINGVKLNVDYEVFVPDYSALPDFATNPTYHYLKFTPDHTTGTFSLSAAITSDDIIRVDFDRSVAII